MEKEIICTVCPMGCRIKVTGEGERIDSIEGYTCKRGETYGRTEFAHPVRILTSTVKLTGSEEPLLPVRSSAPVPKELVRQCIAELRKITVSAPVKRHDVILANVLGTGIDIISSDSVESA